MFASVTKALKRSREKTVTLNDAMRLSERYVESVCNSHPDGERALFIDVLDRDLDSFVAWRGEYQAMLRGALDKPDRERQRLGVRGFVVECVELFAVPKAYFGDEFSDRDRKALSAKLHPNLTLEDSKSELIAQAVFGEASAVAARGVLAAFFQDAKLNDWYDYYYDASIDAAKWRLKRMLEGILVDEPDKFATLADTMWRSVVSEARELILAGGDLEHDPEAIKREEEERERQQEAIKPRKRDEIYPGELRQIAEILEARHHLLQQGQLYRAGDERQFAPIEPLRALPIDAALVWIALRECLERPDDAEAYVKNVILRYLNLVTPDHPGLAESTPDDINIEESKPLIEIHQEDGQWLPRFMMVSFYYLYDIPGEDIQSRDRKKRDFYGRMAVQCAGVAWRLYAQVMNIFGWEISERWIADPEDE
jgi:hypothetical protein